MPPKKLKKKGKKGKKGASSAKTIIDAAKFTAEIDGLQRNLEWRTDLVQKGLELLKRQTAKIKKLEEALATKERETMEYTAEMDRNAKSTAAQTQTQKQLYESTITDLQLQLSQSKDKLYTTSMQYEEALARREAEITELHLTVDHVTEQFETALKGTYSAIAKGLEHVGSDWQTLSAIQLSEKTSRTLLDFDVVKSDLI